MRLSDIKISIMVTMRRMFNLPPEQPVDPVVRENFHYNILVNTGDIVSWMFGISFMAYNTILPVYASRLTDSPLVIGMIPALVEAGWFLPQLFLVPWIERLPRLLPKIAVLTFFERIPFLGFVALAFWQNEIAPAIAVTLLITLVAVRALGNGIMALPYQEMIASVIPVTHRGRFFGVSHLIGGGVGVIGSAVAAYLLNRLTYPNNYAAIFMTGTVFIWVSFFFLIMTREPPRVVTMRPRESIKEITQRLRRLVSSNRNFCWFLFNRGLSFMGNMAMGFLAVYGLQRFHLPDSQAAVYTAAMLASNTIGYGVWGNIADQWGYKRLAEISGLLWIAALAIALLAPSSIYFYLVFILFGLSNGSGIMADFNIAMEFGNEEDRPAYIGLTRTLTGPVLLIAPMIGGAMVAWMGYPAMIIMSLVFTVISLVVLHWWVMDPRVL